MLTFVTVGEEESPTSGAVERGEAIYDHSRVLCNTAFEHTHGKALSAAGVIYSVVYQTW